MKTITIMLFSVLLNGCGSTKNATANLETEKELETKMTQTIQDNTMVIEYTAQTRGSYKMVKVDNKTVSFKNNHSAKPSSKACSKENWSSLMKYIDAVKLEDINTIEPPSKAHQYDGALIASLKITKDGNTYQTPSFDHGNPPKEIAALVNKVIELGEAENTKGN